MNIQDKIRIIKEPISKEELQLIADERFGDLLKGVVDITQGLLALGGEMHADEEALLLDRGSIQNDLWGINLYPDKTFPEMVEFDSMINVRPRQNNRSRGVEDETLRQKILGVVKKLLK